MKTPTKRDLEQLAVRALGEGATERLQDIDGLYLGQLTADETDLLDRAAKLGLASRDYSGPGGLLGLGKVRALAALAEVRR